MYPLRACALCILVASAPLAAQERVILPLFAGEIALTGEVALLEDARTDNSAALHVWRPVLFGTPERPIGGRMDCRLGGVKRAFSDELFNLQQRYRDSREQRRAAGITDEDSRFSETGPVRRLEVTGRAGQPHYHFVLTYLALRDGEMLYDIRLNCEFRHLHAPRGEPDYAAMMRQYVDLAVPIAPSETPSELAPG